MNDPFTQFYPEKEFLTLLLFVVTMVSLAFLTYSLLMHKMNNQTEKDTYMTGHVLAAGTAILMLLSFQPFAEGSVVLVTYGLVVLIPFHRLELGKRVKNTLQYTVALLLVAICTRLSYLIPKEDMEKLNFFLWAHMLFLVAFIVVAATYQLNENVKQSRNESQK